MRKLFIKTLFVIMTIPAVIFIVGCKSVPKQEKEIVHISRNLADVGILSAEQLATFFTLNNDEYDFDFLVDFASYYIDEGLSEGINSDAAFAQMCLETGFLRFGGLVQEEWNNFCGLGAMGPEHPGEIFETEQLGVRAHIQHLQAYATTEDIKLNNELIDPRYNWVHKTKFVEDIWGLAGTWATDPDYGIKIDAILNRMELLINQ